MFTSIILGILRSSGRLEENHIIGRNLTLWKRYEFSVDLNIRNITEIDWVNLTDTYWSNLNDSNWISFFYLWDSSTRDQPIPVALPFDVVPENQWFNLKYIQVS